MLNAPQQRLSQITGIYQKNNLISPIIKYLNRQVRVPTPATCVNRDR